MKRTIRICQVLFLGYLLFSPLISRAEEPTTGFQISLFHPVQLHPDDYSVDGLRVDIIDGVNEDVQGIDIGLVNVVKRDFKGVQVGLITNVTRRSCRGFQAAIFFNDAQEELQGLQLGIVNHTGSLRGFQIGLINFNDDTRYLGFFPFINAAF